MRQHLFDGAAQFMLQTDQDCSYFESSFLITIEGRREFKKRQKAVRVAKERGEKKVSLYTLAAGPAVWHRHPLAALTGGIIHLKAVRSFIKLKVQLRIDFTYACLPKKCVMVSISTPFANRDVS